jgi:hypothetical protein
MFDKTRVLTPSRCINAGFWYQLEKHNLVQAQGTKMRDYYRKGSQLFHLKLISF